MSLDRNFALLSYETLLLSQYHIECRGLFYFNGVYLIHCPYVKPDTLTPQGENLHEWFRGRKIMGTNIEIVNELPKQAIRIDGAVERHISPGSGYLITRGDFDYEINLLIPGIFPDYEIRHGDPLVIAFKEPVTPEGLLELKNIFLENKFAIKCEFVNDPAAHPSTKQPTAGFFSGIIPARYAKNRMGKPLADKWEQDEDEWLNSRNEILADASKAKGKEHYFNQKKFRCIIDCNVGVPSNIRNYLSLYEEVCIVPPMKDTEGVLKKLDVSRDELAELVAMNRLQILAPASIELYDLPLIETLVEANSANVHLTRRLTSLVLKDSIERNPLFFPAISVEERKLLLHSCDGIAQSLNDRTHRKIQKTLSQLGSWWLRMPNALNQMPSGFFCGLGVPDMLDTFVFDKPPATDISLATRLTAPSIGLTAAVGATFVPFEHGLIPVYQMLADLYSGVPDENWIIQQPDYANFAVEDLLVVADRVPVIEFARTFTGAEINRFRETVLMISQNAKSPEDLQENISAFNHFVKSYEKDKKKLNLMNLSGFILGQAGNAKGVPFSTWLIKILQKHVLAYARKNAQLAYILDQMEANIAGAYPNAVLVSGMKTKLKDKI